MWHLFRKKEAIESDEYRKIKKELLDIDTKIMDMESLLFKIMQDIKNIKGKVNSKIMRELDQTLINEENTKDINKSVLLPENDIHRALF